MPWRDNMDEVKIFSNSNDNIAVDFKTGETIAVGDVLMYSASGWLPAASLAVDELLNLGSVGMAIAPSNDINIGMGATRTAPGEGSTVPTAVPFGKGTIVPFTAAFTVENLPAAKFYGTGSAKDRLTLTAAGLFTTLSNSADNAVVVAIAEEDFNASSGLTYKISTVGAGYVVPKAV